MTFTDNSTHRLVTKNLKEFCVNYVNKGVSLFQWSSIACVIIIIGLAMCLMAICGVFDADDRNNASSGDGNEVQKIDRYCGRILFLRVSMFS